MLRERWQRNLAGVVVAAFVSILGFNLVFPFLPLYIQTLGSYDAGEAAYWTGIIGLVTGVVGAVAALVWGQLADRRGRRAMLVRATVGPAVGLVVMGLATGIAHVLAGRVLFSALAGTVPAANPLIAATTPPEHLGFAMGAVQSAVYLSNTLGPLVGGGLAAVVGYRAGFLVTAALYVASAVPVVLLVRERFVPPPRSRGLVAGVAADFGEVVRNRAIAPPILAALLALCAANVATPVVPLLVGEMVGPDRAEGLAGIAFGVQGLAGAVAALSVGRLTARFGHRGLLRLTAPLTMAVFVLLWVAPVYGALVVLLGALGGLQGLQVPALTALIARRAPRERAGAVFGVVSSINTLAFSGGPFVGGVLARAFGLRAVFPVSALLLVPMILLIGAATAPVGERRAAARPATGRGREATPTFGAAPSPRRERD
jgi:DHA1 family multidrug resistance protein-like MFS transporter